MFCSVDMKNHIHYFNKQNVAMTVNDIKLEEPDRDGHSDIITASCVTGDGSFAISADIGGKVSQGFNDNIDASKFNIHLYYVTCRL